MLVLLVEPAVIKLTDQCAGAQKGGIEALTLFLGKGHNFQVKRKPFALGVERLIELMKECEVQNATPSVDAYVVHQGDGAMQAAFSAAEVARDAGLDIVLHAGGGNFKSQLKRADASAARFAIIVGEDEVKSGKLSLKPLRGQGEQATIDITQAIASIKQGRTHGSL